MEASIYMFSVAVDIVVVRGWNCDNGYGAGKGNG